MLIFQVSVYVFKDEYKGSQICEDSEENMARKDVSRSCEECGASFQKPAHLKQHMQSHSLEVSTAVWLSFFCNKVISLYIISYLSENLGSGQLNEEFQFSNY